MSQHLPALFVAGCWFVFVAVWLITGLQTKRTLAASRSLMSIRLVAFVIIVAAGFALKAFHVNVTIPPLFSPAPVAWAGAVLAACGIGFAVWARFHLGKNWGMPMSVKESPELITSGPYALVRHPIYSGMLLALVGSGLAVSLWWLLILLFAGSYFIYSATQEEKLLAHTFPDSYPAYKAKTKMLIPYIF